MDDEGRPQSPEERLAAARSWADHLEPVPSAEPRTGPTAELTGGSPEQMTDRLQTVIETVERAADAIRADAEEQARRHMLEAQQKADQLTAERVRAISDLTDDLIEHANLVREHSEGMIVALERAINGVSGKLQSISQTQQAGQLELKQPDSDSQEEASVERLRPASNGDEGSTDRDADSRDPGQPEKASTEPATPAPTTVTPPVAPDEEPSAEILLRATQLAIAGESRETIGERIREEFSIDPEPVVARVLG